MNLANWLQLSCEPSRLFFHLMFIFLFQVVLLISLLNVVYLKLVVANYKLFKNLVLKAEERISRVKIILELNIGTC